MGARSSSCFWTSASSFRLTASIAAFQICQDSGVWPTMSSARSWARIGRAAIARPRMAERQKDTRNRREAGMRDPPQVIFGLFTFGLPIHLVGKRPASPVSREACTPRQAAPALQAIHYTEVTNKGSSSGLNPLGRRRFCSAGDPSLVPELRLFLLSPCLSKRSQMLQAGPRSRGQDIRPCTNDRTRPRRELLRRFGVHNFLVDPLRNACRNGRPNGKLAQRSNGADQAGHGIGVLAIIAADRIHSGFD